MTPRLVRPLPLALSFGLLLAFSPSFAAANLAAPPEVKDAGDPAESSLRRVRIEGRVVLPDGEPALGAVVVSSAGGSAAVQADGSFALEIGIAAEALGVEVTAVASGARGTLIARGRLDAPCNEPILRAGELVLALSQGCIADWVPTFGELPGTNGTVHALTVFDDGSGGGPALYAGGAFTTAGSIGANGIARWDGEAWAALDGGVGPVPGVPAAVYALSVFDDGSGGGPGLYAGGVFGSAGGQQVNGIARWDGQGWSPLGSGVDVWVRALAVFDDGSGAGPALHAGGLFGSAGGMVASNIAKWDGQAWSALGSGTDNEIFALSVFDDGSGAGPALYAAGKFGSAGGQAANRVAKWDGQSWSALSSGLNGQVRTLAVFDDASGGGPALYAGGLFGVGGGQNNIAKWDGQAWSALGSGTNSEVFTLSVFDDGSGAGPALYAGGGFTLASGQPMGHVAKWDGQSWSALGSGMGTVPGNWIAALAVFDDGSGAGPALHAAGDFFSAGGQSARNAAKWDGQSWSLLGSGVNGTVSAVAAFDDGSGTGPALYVGGVFNSAGGQSLNRIAKWDGQGWSALAGGTGGLDSTVHDLAVFDDGSGPALYAAGSFTLAGGQLVNRIARWDGLTWSALGGGMTSVISPGLTSVVALAVFDDGSGGGPALYAGGFFTSAGGTSASSIARWDGRGWSALGSGVKKPTATSPTQPGAVRALTVFDDGSGPALYVGGDFTMAGGVGTSDIARWDGQGWSALGGGVGDGVSALAVYDDGSGPALYAGGTFLFAGGLGANRIAKWDGQSWSTLSSGVTSVFWTDVSALAAFDDGSGPALYAGGTFTSAGGMLASNIARWDGQSWSALGSGVPASPTGFGGVAVLKVFDDGSGLGPALYVGGYFENSPASDSHLARWACPAIDTVPGCFGNPATLASLTSTASIGGTFSVSLSASEIPSGLGLLFLGLDGTDAAGCGLFVPGIGELLLALTPKPAQVGSGALSGGAVAFALPVPASPSLVGVEVALHGVAVGVLPGLSIELTNALRVTITQ